MQLAVANTNYSKDKELKPSLSLHLHDHNCADCHHHDHETETASTLSLTKKIHEHNGHQCTSQDCPIEAAHGHNLLNTKVHHEHAHYHPNTLENFIGHSSLPQWLKEFILNTSFLAPALLSSSFLEKLPFPKIVKTWLSILSMHLVNRGNTKIGRLGITCAVSGFASLDKSLMHADDSPFKPNITRILATSMIALIEKFGATSNKLSWYDNVKDEVNTIFSNISNISKWKELIPGLLNIEAKVQILVPTVNYLFNKLSSKTWDPNIKKLFLAPLISSSFVFLDSILRYFGRNFNLDLLSASAAGAMCGCCGSPVCAAAATDSAVNNTL